uniref:Putative serine/threonine-protein kinase n=1 Tax=Noccaea caerulescens TaxID=107243 RepID=A0A1J3E1Z9_NOCCA
MGCVLGRPGSPGSVSGSRQHEVSSSTRIESNRKEVNSVSVTKTETTEIAASVAIAAAASNGEEIRKDEEAIVEQKEPNGVVVTETKERKPKSERKRSKPDPRRSNPPKNLLGEQVAAGWPTWLSEVCGEALSGWLPRKADSFEKIDKIGSGTYSNVYKAKDSLTGNIVALKKVRPDVMDRESMRFMAREILILRRLDHPNVIKLEGLVTSRMSNSLYLVFRYMHHDLAGLAASPVITFTEQQVKCYMKQLLSGLEHCHNRGVLHRDIKGSNLLIDDGGVLRIGDFGLATFYDASKRQQMTNRVVTLWYRAPELLHGVLEYGVGVDLWSAGCILAELLAGRPILPGRCEVEQSDRIHKLCGSYSEECWRKIKLPSTHKPSFAKMPQYKRRVREVYKDFSPEALSLLDTLLALDPAERKTATDALRSDFFTKDPLPCEPCDLPKYPPTKEIDAKRRDEEYRRQREARKAQGESGRRMRPRERGPRAMPAPEANAEIQSNIDRMRLITHANAKSKSEKFPPPHQDGSLGFPVGSSRRFDPSEIPYSSNSFTSSYSKEPLQTWSGPLAPIGTSDSTARRRNDINKERRIAVKGKRIAV